MNTAGLLRIALIALVATLLGGCAGQKAFKTGEQAMDRGEYDLAVNRYIEAVQEDPGRHEYRMRLLGARAKAAAAHMKAGLEFAEQGSLSAAEAEFEQVLVFEPAQERGRQELEKVRKLRLAADKLDEAEQFFRTRKFGQSKKTIQKVLSIDPGNQRAEALLEKIRQNRSIMIDGYELDVDSGQPITIKFKEASTKDVFKILSRLSGINFIFDEEIRSKSVTVLLEKATFSQALELLLKMNDLDRRVLNTNTIILFPKTKDKQKQYRDQIIQVFYLSNIDAKKAVNMLRTMLQLRKVFVHEELNALVVRDTPDAIKLAQQIIEAADRADSEVIFELELIQVAHTDELDLGAGLSQYSTSVGLAKEGATTIVSDALGAASDTTNLVSSLSNLQSFYTLPTATFDFKKKLTDSEVLASPKIRVKNKGKAKVHIGTREPVITVTINGDQTSENVQYVDVGVKLDVEPTIQLDGNIVTKLNLEVSSVVSRQTSTSTGTTVLTISTTNAQTDLTLKDGEQTIIGGLIREEDSKDKSSIAFLGDLPLVGWLFTSHSNTKQKSEILLSITPHILRKIDLPDSDQATIWSGGEDDLKAGPNFGSFAAGGFEPELDKGVLPLAPGLEKKSTVSPVSLPVEVLPESPAAEQPAAPHVAPPVAPAAEPAPMPEPEGVDIAVPALPEGIAPIPPGQPLPPALPVEKPVEEVALLPLEIPEAPSQARLFLEGPALVDSGKEFILKAMVAEVEEVYSAPLFVTYDTRLFDFVRAEEGTFLKAPGQKSVFTISPDRTRGQLIIGYKQAVGGKGASGSGELFSLVFKAKAAGSGDIGFGRVNFRNPAGTRIQVAAEKRLIEVR